MGKIKLFADSSTKFVFLCALFTEIVATTDGEKLKAPEVVIGQLCIIAPNGRICSEHDTVAPTDPTFADITNFDKDHIFTFKNNTLRVIFECRDSHPVTWVYTLDDVDGRSSHKIRERLINADIRYSRKASNISDSPTDLFSAWLTLRTYDDQYRQYVGEHVCQWMEKPNAEIANTQKLKLFEEELGVINPFPLSSENITVWMNERNDGSILIPCFVYNQHIKVTLSKMDAPGAWSIVPVTDEVTFLPELGFLFDSEASSKLLSPGFYNCSSGQQEMILMLKSGKRPETPAFAHEITLPATFTISNITEKRSFNKFTEIKCCSNSTTPPVMKLQFCHSKTQCEKLLKYTPMPHSTRDYFRNHEKGNCQSINMMDRDCRLPANVFCKGDGISIHKTLIPKFRNSDDICEFPLESLSGFYVDNEKSDSVWKNMIGLELVWVGTQNGKDKGSGKRILYNNVTLNVFDLCTSASWYFSKGFQSIVTYANGSSMILIEPVIQNSQFLQPLTLNVTKDINSITCLVPELMTERWINKTVEVVVKDGEAPKIIGNEEPEQIIWNEEDKNKTLVVEYSGRPMPRAIDWIKDKVTLKSEHFQGCSSKLTSASTFNLSRYLMSFKSSGELKFRVINDMGEAVKIFQIQVQSKQN